MTIQGQLLQPSIEQCPYLPDMTCMNENLLIQKLTDKDAEMLLSSGFRHFGEFFFRPVCGHCRRCISVRIPVQRWEPTHSVKRLFNRNKHFKVQLETPEISPDKFALYHHHKQKFTYYYTLNEDYELFRKSFFHVFPFSYILTIRDGDHLVAVSHLDITDNAMSAIYCYYDMNYARYSPGKFAIYYELQMAKTIGISWLYLGFTIEKNRHTNYKLLYQPNQVMVKENEWIDYMDAHGNILNPMPAPTFQLLADYS